MQRRFAYVDFIQAVALDDAPRQVLLNYLGQREQARFDTIAECDGCGVLRIEPMPSPEELGRFYASYVGDAGYSKRLDSKIRRATKRLKKLRPRIKAARPSFLDVGCNLGAAVEAARRLGFEAHGIEIGAESVEKAKQLFSECQFRAASAEELAATGAQFDLVYCTEVIEHVADPVGFVRALAQLVKPGGLLYLTTPDAGHWRRPKDFLSWHEVKPPEHVSWQTKRSLRHLFTNNGFATPSFQFTLKPGIRMVVRRGQ